MTTRFILAGLCVLAQSVFAAPTFTWESAERAEAPEMNGALAVGEIQFVATRIQLQDIVHITSIGATMFAVNENATFFVAVLQLPHATSLPSGSPFDGSETLATTIIAGEAIDDYWGTTDLTLNPGYYAIIIGGGEFGATGFGGVPSNNTDHLWASYFVWTDVDPMIPFGEFAPFSNGSWSEGGVGGYRIFLEGTVIPEPSTGILVLFGFLTVWINRRIAQPETRAYP